MNKKANSERKAIAKISWVPAAEGGPESMSLECRYSTAARFHNEAEKWPKEAWSLGVEFSKELQCSFDVIAEVSFLSPDAPAHLLAVGSRFELYEGRRLVACGEIL